MLKSILNKFDVEDIDISEPPIDEIIGKLLINKQWKGTTYLHIK